MPINQQQNLNVAVASVGRMGLRHARNVAFACPRATLVAVCDISSEALLRAREELPAETAFYASFEDMLKHPGLGAVIVASSTAQHAPMAIAALDAGLHVLLEKPISLDLESALPVLDAVKRYPNQKCMLAFSRRFDESYREAHSRLPALGKVFQIKSATNDQYDRTGYFLGYAAVSGGIFIDCGIHDIDIARWFLGLNGVEAGTNQVKRCFAMGQNACHPELEKYGDCDNCTCVVEFENGSSCTIGMSRTSIHGHEAFTEIYGTEGKFVINSNPTLNRMQIMDQHGVRTESTPSYYERFREAFLAEVNEFASCCLDDTPVPSTVADGLEAAKIALGLTLSFRTGQQVFFDRHNVPIHPTDKS